ncbi:MAG: hypothetical protein AAFQ98_20855, partial [Bacteroidota bacterium]
MHKNDGISVASLYLTSATMTLLHTVLLLGCASLFVLLGLFLLSSQQAHQRAYRWLGLLFVLLALNFLDGYLTFQGFYPTRPGLAMWEDPMVLLYGPCIWFFARAIQQRPLTWRAQLLHLAPFLVAEALLALSFHRLPLAQQQELLHSITLQAIPPYIILIEALVSLHILGYLLKARQSLARHLQQLKQDYATDSMRWSQQLLDNLLIVFILALGITLLQALPIPAIYSYGLLVLGFISYFLLARILFQSLRSHVLSPPVEASYAGSFSATDQTRIQQKIEQAMQEERSYLDPDLTLNRLALQLNEAPRLVSQTINQSLAHNFYDLVNGYRIAEAQRRLQDPTDTQLTVLEVMYAVGFN